MKIVRVFAVWVLAALVMGVAGSGAAGAGPGAEVPDDFKCGPIDCDVLKNNSNTRYVRIFALALDDKPVELDKLDETRAKFWEAYDKRDKDPVAYAAAREKLADALFIKDLFIVQMYLWAGIGAKAPNALNRGEDLPAKFTEIAGTAVDGGIAPTARYEFFEWAEATRANLVGTKQDVDTALKLSWVSGVGIMSAMFRKACDPSGKEYQAYVMERDWAEFQKAGRIPSGFDNKKYYGMFLYFRRANYPYWQAAETYAGLKGMVKDDALVEGWAEKIRTAEHKENGDLIVTVPEPRKKGPSGAWVDDYDAVIPDTILGTWRDPLVALEVAVTQGDDRRYLLYLLSKRYFEKKKFLKETNDKWTFAENAYAGLGKEFGTEKVLWAANLVRTAKKRLLTGSVIGEKELGATRQDPFETFEDILCRKYPDGYVKAAIAAGGNLEFPAKVDVEGEYRKLGDEGTVLAAARKAVMGKPNVLNNQELNYLKQVMAGAVNFDKPETTAVDNPDYLAWKDFKAGAKTEYIERLWLQERMDMPKMAARHPDEISAYLLRSVDEKMAAYWFSETVFDVNGARHEPRDTEMGYPAKWEMPKGAARGMMRNPAVPAGTELTSRLARAMAPEPSGDVTTGEEVVEIVGRKIKTQWKSQAYTGANKMTGQAETITVKVWMSDEVPGKLVRRMEDKVDLPDMKHWGVRVVDERYLSGIAGFLPGEAAESKAGAAWTPPELTVSLAPVRAAPATQAVAPPVAPRGVTSRPAPWVAPTQPARGTPEAARRAEVMKQYSLEMARESGARNALVVMLRKNVDVPQEVKDANGRIDTDMIDVNAALRKRDMDALEAALQTMEADVAVVEGFVKK